MTTALDINGRTYTVSSDPETPLLWVLRDELHLTGTKYGCGIAQCGACTVHMNGQPIRSCQTPISTLAGAKITTIEGLGGQHPVQTAWIKLDVPHCGYCQSGQIMSAVALIQTNKAPSDADIDSTMNGNICRCGAYQRIRAAIKEAATSHAASAAV
jgi:isoquinoline 1-oxidoreductase alpha subunit